MMKSNLQLQDAQIVKRRSTYSTVANEFALLSNKHLLQLL